MKKVLSKKMKLLFDKSIYNENLTSKLLTAFLTLIEQN